MKLCQIPRVHTHELFVVRILAVLSMWILSHNGPQSHFREANAKQQMVNPPPLPSAKVELNGAVPSSIADVA